jgi:hypothetical protein
MVVFVIVQLKVRNPWGEGGYKGDWSRYERGPSQVTRVSTAV